MISELLSFCFRIHHRKPLCSLFQSVQVGNNCRHDFQKLMDLKPKLFKAFSVDIKRSKRRFHTSHKNIECDLQSFTRCPQ